MYLINVVICSKIETEAVVEEEDEEGSDSESGEVLDLCKVTEMRLVPSDASLCNYLIFLMKD